MTDSPENGSSTDGNPLNDSTVLVMALAIFVAIGFFVAIVASTVVADGGEQAGHGASHGAPHGSTVIETGSPIQISDAWVRASLGANPNTAVYFTVYNTGGDDDSLIGVTSRAARTAELHATVFDGGMMRMQSVRAIPVPSGGSQSLAPGGLHLMLLGVVGVLSEGDVVPLTLEFEKAGSVDVLIPVRVDAVQDDDEAPLHDHHNGHGDDGAPAEGEGEPDGEPA